MDVCDERTARAKEGLEGSEGGGEGRLTIFSVSILTYGEASPLAASGEGKEVEFVGSMLEKNEIKGRGKVGRTMGWVRPALDFSPRPLHLG